MPASAEYAWALLLALMRRLPAASPDWLVAADFGPGMYGRLVAAVGRPGMGTVTDCLLAGVRVFAFHEPGNEEVALTARRLADLGLGEACANARAAWQAALTYLDDPGGPGRSTPVAARLCRARGPSTPRTCC